MEQVHLAQFGFEDIQLMEGERIESSLDLNDENDDSEESEVMLLTDKRVVYLSGSDKNRKAAFASVHEISVVEVNVEREGIGSYIWAGLAFFVAVMLWRVIDHPLGSVAAGIIVALMGVYLIVDHLMTPGRPVATFKSGSSEFRADLKGEHAATEIYGFINRLFQLKEEGSSVGASRPQHFALR